MAEGPRQTLKPWPGRPYPLGASWDGSGVNFSLFSEVAERVELCLFDDGGRERRVDLPEVYAHCWHGYLPGVKPGQRYGYRVHGPWDPERGHRCDPSKLLIDPYAKAMEGRLRWDRSLFSEPPSAEGTGREDSAPYVPRCVVIDEHFDWEDDRHPRTPLHDTLIYEVHVKGFTALHPSIPEAERGTYAGMAHPAALEHLRRLGVTAVELLPVHQFIHQGYLLERGLKNYWGYDSIGFFAPHDEYASARHLGQQVREFKTLVKTLHRAGLEVILDVVYNHTAEGNHLGPTLSFRGIDNSAYYRLVPGDERHYMDFTGTGNSLNMRHPHTLQLLMDSLRYWVLEMHVDGFRFDLASALAREFFEVDRLSAFFDVIQQDPVISQVKLIAEPWDVGEGGYQVGNFPPLWLEWNGRYRDTIRDFWRGADHALADFANRISGSSDLYQATGRRPFASVNFVTAHDGFTLTDLVAYERKHNEANGEDNRDGDDHSRSWNSGCEGPADDPSVLELRARQRRNLLATLILSQGVPMLLGGDELGRTQQGNNNAYCHDSELTWFDWTTADRDFLAFAQHLISFYRAHPVFRRRRWFQGRPIRGSLVRDIVWFRPDGKEMSEQDWNTSFARALGVFLNGRAIPSPDRRGRRILDDSFLLLFNAHYEALEFVLPGSHLGSRWIGRRWVKALDTADPIAPVDDRTFSPRSKIRLIDRSMLVLRRVR